MAEKTEKTHAGGERHSVRDIASAVVILACGLALIAWLLAL